MVNRNDHDTRTRPETDTHTRGPVPKLTEVRSAQLSRPDDVISVLANERENLRARQVGEWERLRHRTFGRAL